MKPETLDDSSRIARDWVRLTRLATDQDVSDDECEWFGRMAATVQELAELLAKVRPDGSLKVDTIPASHFLRFYIVERGLWLLRGSEAHSWVSVLDEYSDEAAWSRGPDWLPERHQALSTVAVDFRKLAAALIAALTRRADARVVGRLLGDVFVSTCGVLTAAELEARRLLAVGR
jgi:hypothetical protein